MLWRLTSRNPLRGRRFAAGATVALPRAVLSTPSYLSVLRCGAVAPLLLAAAFARLADRVLSLGLVLYALERFQSAPLAGCLGFAVLAPGLLVSPLAGAWLDRVGAVRAIAVDLWGSASCFLVLGALAATRTDGVVSFLSIVALYSLSSPLSAAGVRSLLPGLVPAEALQQANAIDTGLHAVTDVCGPAIAGGLIRYAGGPAALLMPAVLFLGAGAAIVPLGRLIVSNRGACSQGLLAAAVGGVRYVLRHPTLRPLAVSYATYQVGWGILLIVVPVAIARAAGGAAAGGTEAGALWAVAGIAGAGGALLAGRLGAQGRERAMLLLGMIGSAVAMAFAVGFSVQGLPIGLVAAGFLAGPVDVALLTLRQRRTEPGWLGRVMAVSMSLNLSGLPIGSALGGVLVGWSVPGALVAAAAAFGVAAVAGWWVPGGARSHAR